MEWHITAPVWRCAATCATCGEAIGPSQVRARWGGRKRARVHHVRCITHEPDQASGANGWAELTEVQRASVLDELKGSDVLDQLCSQPAGDDAEAPMATSTRDTLAVFGQIGRAHV